MTKPEKTKTVTTHEASRILGVGETVVRRCLANGHFPGARRVLWRGGYRWEIPRVAVEEFGEWKKSVEGLPNRPRRDLVPLVVRYLEEAGAIPGGPPRWISSPEIARRFGLNRTDRQRISCILSGRTNERRNFLVSRRRQEPGAAAQYLVALPDRGDGQEAAV